MRAAVLGSPIAHSLSPVLHRAAYRELGLDWSYEAIEVDSTSLAGFIDRLDETWAGLSLTMPLKEDVIALLDDVDDVALIVSAVNTVLPGPAGWRGTNTDVYGIVQAVKQHQPDAGSALVLGAGATARSAVAALAQLGVRRLTVASRQEDAGRAIVALAVTLGLEAEAIEFSTPSSAAMAADIVVSTLPGDVGSQWVPACSASTGVLLDVSYHPWPTPLATAWPLPRVASGRDMLLWQAAEQVRLMTGRPAPVEAMASALARAEAADA